MEIYRLHENIGGNDEEGNSEKNCEKDLISAGFTLKAFSEVSTTKSNALFANNKEGIHSNRTSSCSFLYPSLFLGKMMKPTQNFNCASLLIVLMKEKVCWML